MFWSSQWARTNFKLDYPRGATSPEKPCEFLFAGQSSSDDYVSPEIWLLSGIDHLGADTIDGGRGNDKILGVNGDDLILGVEGNDSLYGGNGADRVYCRAGDDELVSGDPCVFVSDYFWPHQSNLLNGGTRMDRLIGSDNARDIFEFSAVAGSAPGMLRDTIINFDAEDRIDLSGIDANT